MGSAVTRIITRLTRRNAPVNSGDQDTGLATPGFKQKLTGILQITVVVLLVAGAVVYSREPAAEDESTAAQAAPFEAADRTESARLVSVIQPIIESHAVSVETTGSVSVRNYVSLTPQVTGKIVSVSSALRVGGAFKAGEILLSIEATDYELALAQAEAEVASAAANLLLQEAESDAARSNYNLIHPDEAVPPLVGKLPQIEQARAQLASANARRDIAALELQRTRFSLPFSGRVNASSAELGQMLSRGQEFGQAFAMDAVEVTVPVSLDDLEKLSPAIGRVASIQIGDRVLTGTVERVAAELEKRTRFSRLYVSIDDQAAIPPGTFVTVQISGPALNDTITVPEAAEQVGGSLWVVNGGELRQHKPMIFGRADNGLIVEAFDFGEGIVTGAVPGGRDGLKVKLSEATL